MTTSPSSTILRAPGRLVVNPTDLGAAFPYGGSEAGLAQSVRLDRKPVFSPDFMAEEYGSQAYDGLKVREDYSASAVLAQWTDDTLAAAGWPASSGSGTIPSASYDCTTSTLPARLAGLAHTLLFVPEEVFRGGSATGDRALAFLLYRAHPAIQEPVTFSGFGSALMFVAWKGLPNDSGEVCQLAAFGDLSL